MSFWDDPQNWPGDDSWPRMAGEMVEGTITRMAVRQGRYGRLALCVELDGDGRERWANSRLWRTLADARIEPGDRVRITRGPDEPRGDGQRPATSWRVERSTAIAPPPAAAQQATGGPTW